MMFSHISPDGSSAITEKSVDIFLPVAVAPGSCARSDAFYPRRHGRARPGHASVGGRHRGVCMSTRREFLRGTAAASLSLAAPADLFAQAATAVPANASWDSGTVGHLLPTASDTRLLIKASFKAPLPVAP